MNALRGSLALVFICGSGVALSRGQQPQIPKCTLDGATYQKADGTFEWVPNRNGGISLPAIAASNPVAIRGTYAPNTSGVTVTFRKVEIDPFTGGDVSGTAQTLSPSLWNGVWTVNITVAAGKVYRISAVTTYLGQTSPAAMCILNVANP